MDRHMHRMPRHLLKHWQEWGSVMATLSFTVTSPALPFCQGHALLCGPSAVYYSLDYSIKHLRGNVYTLIIGNNIKEKHYSIRTWFFLLYRIQFLPHPAFDMAVSGGHRTPPPSVGLTLLSHLSQVFWLPGMRTSRGNPNLVFLAFSQNLVLCSVYKRIKRQ